MAMTRALRIALPLLLVAGCAGSATRTPSARMPATSGIVAPAATAQARDAARELAIDSVGVEPKTLRLDGARPEVLIRYTLTRPATVRIDLVDEEGRLAQRLSPGRQKAGPHAAAWDGAAFQGAPAPDGVYRYLIEAAADDGAQVLHDPSTATGGEELMARDFRFDKATGRLEWVLPRTGYTRVRAGIEGFPHLRTLMDWTPTEGGRRHLDWGGLDASGLVKLAEHPKLSIRLTAFAVPDNTVLVVGSPTAAAQTDEPPIYPPMAKAAPAYLHARHPRAECGEASLAVEFPGSPHADAQGRPVLSGQTPVRVTIDAANAARIVNRRFELVVYEDLTVLFEEEESTNPFTFLWDTSKLPPGEHLLTINLLSYDDHYAVRTVPVVIKAAATQ
jgi:hypothetical protein